MSEFLQSIPPKKQQTETVGGFTGLLIPAYDYVGITYPDAVTEVYVFRSGGSGGTVQGMVTLVYTDSGKDSLSTMTKTPRVN